MLTTPVSESNVIPIIRTYQETTGINRITGQELGMTRIKGYGLCVHCGTRVAAYITHWAKSAVPCSACGALTRYVKKDWRKTQLLRDDQDVSKYFSVIPPQPQTQPIAQAPNTDLALLLQVNRTGIDVILAELKAILAELKALNEKWSN